MTIEELNISQHKRKFISDPAYLGCPVLFGFGIHEEKIRIFVKPDMDKDFLIACLEQCIKGLKDDI